MRQRYNAVASAATSLQARFADLSGWPLNVVAVTVAISRVSTAEVVDTPVAVPNGDAYEAETAILPAGLYYDTWSATLADASIEVRRFTLSIAPSDEAPPPGPRADGLHPLRLGERAFPIAQPGVFLWEAPGPVDPSSTVQLTEHFEEPDAETLHLVPLAPASIAVSEVRDGRLLIPVAPAQIDELRHAAGSLGGGYLITDERGTIPVLVVRTTGDAIEIADYPSRSLDGPITGQLVMSTWWAALPPETARVRDVPWSVRFSSGPGHADVERGILSWERTPFDTGLTPLQLLRDVPDLVAQVHSRQASLARQIMSAREELAGSVRAHLAGTGMTEHDLVGVAPGLCAAHVSLTLAHVYASDPAEAEAFRAQALGALDERLVRRGGSIRSALRRVLTDADGDGRPSAARSASTPTRLRRGSYGGLSTSRWKSH